jgi:hypothetical protein
MSNFQDFDLTILPPKEVKEIKDFKRPLDPRLPRVEKGCLMILCAMPNSGKSVVILNLLSNSNLLRGYYDNAFFFGPSMNIDETLEPLIEYYGNCSTTCTDEEIQEIIDFQEEMPKDEKTNSAIIIDDALALKNMNKRGSRLARLCSNYRHILGTKTGNGGGLLLISTQRMYGELPTSIRACANCIVIGALSNKSELKRFIEEYDGLFSYHLMAMINQVLSNKYHFLCLYLNGDMNGNSGPVAYDTFNELLYPTEKFPKKEYKL